MKRLLLVTLAVSALCLAPQAFSQKILTTIQVGGQPGDLAVNPTTNMIYVPNTTLDTVTVVDGSSNQVVANVPAGLGPAAVAVNPVTNLVYVANYGGSELQNPSIIVIDGSSNTVVATVPATLPGAIAVNSVTNMVYFSNGPGAAISVLDGSTNQIVATLTTAQCCLVQGIAVNTTTNRIYVAENGSAEQIVEINGRTNDFNVFQVAGVCDLRGVAVDSALNRLYVTDDICGELYVISGATNKTVATVPGYYGPVGLGSSSHVIADFDLNLLGFINEATNAPTGGSVAFPISAIALNIAAGSNNRYYATFRKTNGIVVVAGPQGGGADRRK